MDILAEGDFGDQESLNFLPVTNEKASLLSRALLIFAVVLCRMWIQLRNRQE